MRFRGIVGRIDVEVVGKCKRDGEMEFVLGELSGWWRDGYLEFYFLWGLIDLFKVSEYIGGGVLGFNVLEIL